MRLSGAARYDERGDLFERLFVYGVLIAMSAGVVYYVAKFGRNVPFWDDWEMVSGLTGNEPTGARWLFQLQNEHLVPLMRLTVLAVWRLTGDLRAVMVISNLLLSAAAAALVLAARTLRGSTSYVDAVFPLAMLHWGHFENMIFAQQLVLVIPVATSCVFLAVAIAERWRDNIGHTILLGMLLLATPVNGVMGVVLAMPLAVWAAVAGVATRRDGDRVRRRTGTVLMAFAAGAGALVLTCLVLIRRAPDHPPFPGFRAVLRVTMEVLNQSLGPPASLIWPYAGIGACVVLGLGVAACLWSAAQWSSSRLRAALVLACIAGYAGIALAIGYGRAGYSLDAGFAARYTVFAAPAVAVAAVAFVAFLPARMETFLGTLLLACYFAMLPLNYFAGKAYGYDRAGRADGLLSDAMRGLPPDMLARRYENKLYPARGRLAEWLGMLARTRSSVFANASPVEGRHSEEITPTIVGTNDFAWSGDHGVATGPDPHVIVALPAPKFVYAIDITFVLDKPTPAETTLESFAMLTGKNGFEVGARNDIVAVTPSAEPQSMRLWINDEVDRIRIDPGAAPAEFELSRITLVGP